MDIELSHLHLYTETIWTSVLGLEVQLDTDDLTPSETVVFLRGEVAIGGAWQGRVVLDCSIGLARHAASVMFGEDPATVSPTAVRDALGELTNMVGGNLKALLPGPSKLGLPRVIEPGNCGSLTALPDAVRFRCGEWPFQVAVLATAGNPGAKRGFSEVGRG